MQGLAFLVDIAHMTHMTVPTPAATAPSLPSQRLSLWIKVLPQGLYVEPGDFFVDPVRPAARAVITHGHADHARPNNERVLATPETLAIMRARYGDAAGGSLQPLPYGERLRIGDVDVSFARPVMSLAALRRCWNTAAAGSWRPATTSAAPIRPAHRSSRSLRCLHHRSDLRPAGVPPSA